MKNQWQDMINALRSGDSGPADLSDTAGLTGKLELMLIRLQADPCPDRAADAMEIIELLPWRTLPVPENETLLICIIRLGRILSRLGRIDRADAVFRMAVDRAGETSCPRLPAIAHMELGELARRRGMLDIAADHQTRAMESAREAGLDREEADALNNLANVAIESGDLDRAETLLGKSLDIAESIGETRLEGHIYNNLGVINCLRGQFDDALSDFNRAIPLREQAGDTRGLSETYHNMGLALLDSGRPDTAVDYVNRALTLAQDNRDAGQEAHIMLTLTELTYHRQDLNYALSMAEQLSQRQDAMGDRPGLAETHKLIGRIYLDQDIFKKAEDYLNTAITMFRSLGLRPGEAETLKTLGVCCLRQGKTSESRSFLERARNLFARLGNQMEINAIDTLMAS